MLKPALIGGRARTQNKDMLLNEKQAIGYMEIERSEI